MRSGDGGRLARVPDVLAAVAGIAAIAVYLVTAAQRLGYPYALEWLEGNSLVEAERSFTGRPLYTAPSVDYVPAGYPPLYFWVSAGLIGVFGVSYLPLRLVSLVASLACFALIARLVQRETGRLTTGLAAAGLYAATYFSVNTWFDFARVDSLFLAFSLAGLYVARWMRGPCGAIGAGLLLGAAFLTKQSALAQALVIIVVLLSGPRRRLAAVLAATFVGVVGLSTLLLGASSHGWYVFYVLELFGQHPLVPDAWAGFWISNLLPVLGIAIVAVLVAPGRVPLVVAAACLALVVEGYAGLLKTGGAVNNMMPAYAAVALLAGITVGSSRGSSRASHHHYRTAAAALVVLQIGFLAVTTFDPGRVVPTIADRRVGDGVRSWLSGLGGRVAVFSDPGLNVAAGLPPVAHRAALHDVLRGTDRTARRLLTRNMAQAIIERRFTAIVVEGRSDLSGFPRDLSRHYRRCPGDLLAGVPRPVFRPVGGAAVRPAALWLPTGAGSCEAALRLLAVKVRP